jgi:pimeloyl-ACP methyl ester carboxylesterase
VDAVQGLFGGTAQYDYAIEDAKKIVSRFPGREITFVGHSLGGGLATAAAAATGMRALTFNAAGVHPRTVARFGASLKGIDNLVDAFRVNGEFLSTLQDSLFLAGYLMPNGNGTRFNLPAQPGKNLFELHKISFVNWGLRHVNS